MALVFTKLPGAKDRALLNAVPGLHERGHGGCGGLRVPLTGAALRLEKRRRKLGIVLGWTSLVCSLVFVTAVLVGLVARGAWTELDAVIFGWIWGVTAIVVHLVVFIAEALRGRDAPRAIFAVVLFWVGTAAVVAM